MKIAYILDDDISIETGVIRKIKAKIRIWNKFDHEVCVFALRSINNRSVIDNSVVVFKAVNDGGTITFEKVVRQFRMSITLDGFLSKFKPDLIYMRNMKYYPRMVKVLKKYAPFVVEFNTIQLEEQKLYSKFGYFYSILTRDVLLRNASGFVSVSNEIIENKSNAKYNKPSIVIGNGYDFKSVKSRKESFNDKLKFVFVGLPGLPWHGMDKIIYLSNQFLDYEFHIIGPTIDDLPNFKIGNNVIFHGYLGQNKLEYIVAQCDIGISTLALHRNNMQEASPLKSRQYLAQGLPIIIGYKDTDLSGNLEYVLDIGNYEDNVKDGIEKIKKFVDTIKNMNSFQIISQSKESLSYNAKEKSRLEFFKEIIKTSKSIN